jgi:hypothetical protein
MLRPRIEVDRGRLPPSGAVAIAVRHVQQSQRSDMISTTCLFSDKSPCIPLPSGTKWPCYGRWLRFYPVAWGFVSRKLEKAKGARGRLQR